MDFGLEELVRPHFAAGARISIAVVQVENAGRFGTATADSNERTEYRIQGKVGTETPRVINVGADVIDSSVLDLMPKVRRGWKETLFRAWRTMDSMRSNNRDVLSTLALPGISRERAGSALANHGRPPASGGVAAEV